MDIYEKLAHEIYEKFVVNRYAVAVQNSKNTYITAKVSFSEEMIATMLRKGYSLGTYQQQYFNDKLQWICFDFDTKRKADNNDDLFDLKDNYVIPFLRRLDELEINYGVEFSGRRGFHIWLLLNQIISKNLAYSIVRFLINNIYNEICCSNRFGLDLFPKTTSGKVPNKYGLQVKLPLSRHKASGTYSYFIDKIDEFDGTRITNIDSSFLCEQLNLIKEIKTNNVLDLLDKCGLDYKTHTNEFINYHKQFVSTHENFTLKDIEGVFLSDKALSLIWQHISYGTLDTLERMILVGIFSHISCGNEVLEEIFKLQNNYKKEITNEYISRIKKYYFPITFKYLYQYLHLKDCPKGNESIYLDDYILQHMGIKYEKHTIKNKEREINFIKDIVDKELNYFYYNDEVYNYKILNQMRGFSYFDYSNIEKYISNIEQGEVKIPDKIEIYKYIRKESDKERILVSLGAKERILTTALINKLIIYCQKDYKSYSYHINLSHGGDVFFPWISSWTRFINEISQYFTIPFFEDFHFLKIDFRHFYDSIFVQTMLDRIANKEMKASKEYNNIYHYLCNFNDKVMLDVKGTIKGVPQGPAYARVLAEITMDETINSFLEEHPTFSSLKIYRYVDDMYVFGEDKKLIDDFYKLFSKYFETKGLFFNKDKTRNYGAIKNLSSNDKNELKMFRDFNYDMFQAKKREWQDESIKDQFNSIYLRYIFRKDEWDINDANLIFSEKIDDSVKERYLRDSYKNILNCTFGRGSLYRKFYNYVFSIPEFRTSFFENMDYLEIPTDTINFSNFICEMIEHYKTIKMLGDKYIEELFEFLSKFNDENTKILMSLLEE